ncbi:MAG TPA: hypothetical protein VGB52_06320 [Actinomycetota bacterium]
MGTYEFTLILEGPDVLGDEAVDALFESGCGDATFGEVDGSQYADFTRRARSLADAIGSAKRAIESAVPGVRVIRVEPEDLVTAADIADRTGRTRESVRLLIAGERGPGRFPPPISHLRSRGRIWKWADVARWFLTELGEEHPSFKEADFISALNGALEVRRMADRIERASEREEVARLVREDAALYG